MRPPTRCCPCVSLSPLTQELVLKQSPSQSLEKAVEQVVEAQKPAETVDRRSVKQLVVRRARAAFLTQMPGEISWNCRR